MRDYPEVMDLARQAQQRLAGFDGLHMTPLRWLHITTSSPGQPPSPAVGAPPAALHALRSLGMPAATLVVPCRDYG
jgi:hypothetical protein